MEPIFQQDFPVQELCVDRYGRLKPSTLLYFAQEIAGRHCDELADTLESHRLFWAVTRHRVQINRLPELWVLMDQDTRSSVSPDKSGIIVPGTLRGTELALPGGLVPRAMEHSCQRDVCFTDLDRNGHMNNTRYMDWIDDLLPSDFHREHPVKEFAVRYHSEAREGQRLDLHWDFVEDNCLRVDARRRNETKDELVFSAKVLFD